MDKEIIKPAVTLFLICAIITALLAAVYGVTAPIIAAREASDTQAALSKVLPDADAFGEPATAASLAASGMTVPDSVQMVYQGTKAGAPAGMVVEVAPRGYGGAITMLVGIGSDGLVTRVEITSMNETPGLGTKAKDEAFHAQFAGLRNGTPPAVVKTGRKNAGEIDAISGATITSKAVAKGVADALALVGEVK